MFKLKQSICYPGNPARPNEDITGWGKDYFFVMDGASCLSGINVVDPDSDAAWMVREIHNALCKHLDAEDPRPTREILRQILIPIRQQYFNALEERVLSKPDDSPSAGIALFRQRNNKLEFFGLGDCVGVASLPDGNTFVSLDTNLTALDNLVLKEMLRIHRSTGMSIQEARQQCNDLLLTNRTKRNHPEGYWILDLVSDDGLENAREFSWELSSPITVGGFSDGFAQLAEVFHIYRDYQNLFCAMQTTELEQLWNVLCLCQDEDADCNDYPRFKLRDDTCALWGIFS